MPAKALCPANCGKRFISKEHANVHADKDHPGWNDPSNVKRRGWVTPYGFGDFTEAVTYDEACEMMKPLAEDLAARWGKDHPTNNSGGSTE